jgi:hypothetical protein
MVSVTYCREQAEHCIRSADLALGEIEAKAIREIGYTWKRLASQIERYNDAFVRRTAS